MFKLFSSFSAVLFVIGTLLFCSSFFVNVSMWFGIELIKGGVFLFLIGMFLQSMHEFERNKSINE
ncbi:hypothetical protein CD30_16720 [Ureibacillus massiliensis 4400831 = CIP 108448 = CCUG 49529]|uniref:Uncharacterized protein n=1 Tax=Ureibacillus massiliensis 4400831 = CIP 108448 = CCUG 49529 TaxID=1211035 RepID=A0A0A3J2R8_9BACL|nr:hypothetical protein [Ureibacillus massiliensis]KGR89488.1 hypothetical protein CD30_16720 [Ureibacillus massiliensis 4400831 = CIP 108448 = CCUG 49529]